MAQFPFSPLASSLLLPFHLPLTYLKPSFGVIRSRPPWPQVALKLTSPSPSPPRFKFPTPQVNCAPH